MRNLKRTTSKYGQLILMVPIMFHHKKVKIKGNYSITGSVAYFFHSNQNRFIIWRFHIWKKELIKLTKVVNNCCKFDLEETIHDISTPAQNTISVRYFSLLSYFSLYTIKFVPDPTRWQKKTYLTKSVSQWIIHNETLSRTLPAKTTTLIKMPVWSSVLHRFPSNCP